MGLRSCGLGCCITFVLLGIVRVGALFGAGLAIHPMEQFLDPNKSVTYVASNQGDTAIAVEVVAETWTIDEQGKEISHLTDDVVAYPSQFILKGLTYKNIKVGLRHPSRGPDVEKTYRVTIRELPINLEPQEPGTYQIYQASAYRTSLYVRPARPKPNLQFLEARLDDDVLHLRVRNAGNAHIHLLTPELTVYGEDGSKLVVTDGDTLEHIMGENMHAGIVRRFNIDLSAKELPKHVVKATIQFKDRGILQPKIFDLPLR